MVRCAACEVGGARCSAKSRVRGAGAEDAHYRTALRTPHFEHRTCSRSVQHALNEPRVAIPIAKEPIGHAAVERHVPFIAVPRALARFHVVDPPGARCAPWTRA